MASLKNNRLNATRRFRRFGGHAESLETRAMLAGDVGAAVLEAASHAGPIETVVVDVVVGEVVDITRPGRGGWAPAPRERFQVNSDAQRDNLKQLHDDLEAIRADSEVTPEMVGQLVADLTAAADGATPPSEESVTQLKEDFTAAVEDGQFTPAEVKTLQDDFAAVLESAGVSAEAATAIKSDLRVIIEASGVDQEDVKTIVADLTAIAEEFKNRTPVVSDAQKENLETLITDLKVIAADVDVTAEALAQIHADVAAMLADATRPDRLLVHELKQDLREALSDGEVTDDEKLLIAQDVDDVFESAGITAEARATLWGDIEATGFTKEDLQTIAEDLAAIRQEFRANHPGRGGVERPASSRR
jgi:hypothetical protein